ncbi:DUF1842 domain-containing protein [Trinickia terrae]|uniref:DUF1842 domain-containing protein n=1 Tax=Trinickia terrae TaxID=2571161 RepID=A0A4U1IDF7_9BURK|nr:DUF1842 domain-containing protein [Trinickia terrae]TKC91597.1 DUF1842 domain-containing protein [Trinickia terrae]
MSASNPVGLFPVRYLIGTGMAGAPSLGLNLLVDTPERRVVGTAAVTQAVNPPLDFHADVWGSYTYLTLMPPVNSRILVTAEGNSGGPTSNSMVTFKLRLLLNSDWQTGVATYEYWDNGSWHEVANVPAKIDREFVPLEPGPVIPGSLSVGNRMQTLYGPSLQQSRASGDLAQMKALAAFAQQQLNSRDDITSALAALKAEIGKLGG